MSEQKSIFQLQRTAQVQTSNGSKYLQRLCKHFAHKVEAEWDETQGVVTFAEGVCHLQANNLSLQITCSADNKEELADVVDTLDRHLLRFAKSETPLLNWQHLRCSVINT